MFIKHIAQRAKRATALIKLLSMTCFLGLTSCSQKATFESLTTSEFKTLIAQPGVQLLDVRTADEHAAGCIAGSRNIDVLQESTFLAKAKAELQPKLPVAVYCRSGKRSKSAALMLSREGFKVYDLDGGYMAWVAAEK